MRSRWFVPSLALLLGAALCAPARIFAEAIPADAAEPAVEGAKAPAAEGAKAKAEAPKPPAAPSSLQIKAGENANIRFGITLQAQADWQELPAGGYAQNFLLRRTRFLAAGQVSKTMFFFFQTENSRLGAVNAAGSKVISSGFQVLDAVGEWRVAKEFNLWAGLIYLPTSREALKSSSSEFMLDTSTYAYTASTALAATGGRDTGFMARGYFVNDRLEYRVGAFQGLRDSASRNPFRTIARLQYNFFDTEVYNLPAYAGSNFGKKKILALGAAYDTQLDYQGYTADLFADIPTGFGAVVGTAVYHHLDGGVTVKTLPKQELYHVDAGLYFKGSKVGPWARYEQKNVSADSTKGEKRWLAGINYYVSGNNLNLKAAYGRVSPDSGNSTNQFTIQLQASYF